MCVKIATESTPCNGDRQETTPTLRISPSTARLIRKPRTFGTTRARPENRYQPITEMLTR